MDNKKTTLEEILEQLDKHPKNLAIITNGDAVTYKQLIEFSFNAASVLKTDGIEKGDFVSIELPRIWQYLGLCIATWICGAAFITSDTAYPQARRDYIAQDCNAKIRINQDYLAKLQENIAKIQTVDKNASTHCFPSLSDAAFAIYTSGSTGNPKGVIHNHLSLAISCKRHSELAKLTPEDHWASPAAFSFITGIISVLSVLTKGASCYVVPDDARKDLAQLSDFCAEHDINIMFLPPAIVPYFKQKKKTIRTMFTGSERAINVFSNEYEIINCWGPTEMCNIILAFHIDKPYVNTPIGLPVGEEKAYVLDENDNEVTEGELCISGHMAKEYIGRPEESSKVFRPNPFKEKDGFDIIIHSGDCVKRLDDGNIVFIERNDWMVNINGQRVEPGEISAVISQIPQILKCEVVGFEKKDKSTGLCAYYQPVAPIQEDQIKDHVQNHLPEYMMPEKFIVIKELPMLANGKINRNKLQNPFLETEPNDLPNDEITNKLLRILQESSGRSDYRYDEDLTKAGISSLTAMKLLATIDDEFGVTIKFKDITDGVSIKSIVEIIKANN